MKPEPGFTLVRGSPIFDAPTDPVNSYEDLGWGCISEDAIWHI
jgi:hypothetical protein